MALEAVLANALFLPLVVSWGLCSKAPLVAVVSLLKLSVTGFKVCIDKDDSSCTPLTVVTAL